jgi:hypothetical protein
MRSSIAAGRDAWGVVWAERVDGLDAIFFVRVGADGRRRAAPIRVTERGVRGRWPAIFWNGSAWIVLSSGGTDRWDELWLQRIDGQGALLGPPRRVSSRDRHDRWPAAAVTADRGALLAWSSEIPGQMHTIQTLRVGEWGQQMGRPALIAERTAPLARLAIVSSREGFLLCWTTTRRSSFVIECAALDALGAKIGTTQRLTEQMIAEGEQGPGVALASTNQSVAIAWEQFSAGESALVFASHSGRLRLPIETHLLALDDATVSSPALSALGDGRWALAFERGYATADRSVVVTLQRQWQGMAAPNARMRGNDGTAASPALSLLGERLAVLSTSGRGLSVHTISLQRCLAE